MNIILFNCIWYIFFHFLSESDVPESSQDPQDDEQFLDSLCEIIVSNRGKEKVIHNGFAYNFEKEIFDNERQFWRCEKRKSKSCKGSLTTKKIEGIYKAISFKPHCHIADATSVINQKFKVLIKNAASTTSDPPAKIHQRQFGALSEDESYFVQSLNTCRQMVKRKRKNNLPSEPLTLDQYTVPPIFHDFCLKDIKDDDENRVIIFGKNEHLKTLCDSPFIIMDGTFYVVSRLFYQLYTIHARISPRNSPVETAPVVYALMSSKNTESYRLLMNSLVQIADNFNMSFEPEKILTDIEPAMIKVVAEVVNVLSYKK